MISSLRNVKRNSILGIHTEGRPEKGAEEQNVFTVFILGNLTFAFTLAPDAKTRMSNGSFRCFRVASCKYSVGTNTVKAGRTLTRRTMFDFIVDAYSLYPTRFSVLLCSCVSISARVFARDQSV